MCLNPSLTKQESFASGDNPYGLGLGFKLQEFSLGSTKIRFVQWQRDLVSGPSKKQDLARALILQILKNEIDIPVSETWNSTFATDAHGKPHFRSSLLQGNHFNMAYSENLLAFVTSTQGPVGVDIESTQRPIDVIRVLTQLGYALPSHFNPIQAWALWCRHEAYIKMLGLGFRAEIDSKLKAEIQESNKAMRALTSTQVCLYNFNPFKQSCAALAYGGLAANLQAPTTC